LLSDASSDLESSDNYESEEDEEVEILEDEDTQQGIAKKSPWSKHSREELYMKNIALKNEIRELKKSSNSKADANKLKAKISKLSSDLKEEKSKNTCLKKNHGLEISKLKNDHSIQLHKQKRENDKKQLTIAEKDFEIRKREVEMDSLRQHKTKAESHDKLIFQKLSNEEKKELSKDKQLLR